MKVNYFIQYQAMRTSNKTEPYWEDRWLVSELHPAHFIKDLEDNYSTTDEPEGNNQTWRYRIVFAMKYYGEFYEDGS